MTLLLRKTGISLCALLMLTFAASLPAAPPLKVESAEPSIGEQGTEALEVLVSGNGFDENAEVSFFLTGTESDSGGVEVTSVTVHNGRSLTARVRLTQAQIGDFDIEVRTLSGRKGRGISLFKVQQKGGGSGNEDTTPPAAINDLSIEATMYAVTLEFTTPGDDGFDGEASAYDVRYQENLEGVCPGSTPVDSWPVAERVRAADGSVITLPEQPGATDWFNVRTLIPDTDYCVAIRALDEVGNGGPYAVAEVRTLAGPWTLETIADNVAQYRAMNLAFTGDAPSGSGMSAVAWVDSPHVAFEHGTTFTVWDSISSPSSGAETGLTSCNKAGLPCFDIVDLSIAQDPVPSGRLAVAVSGRYSVPTGRGKKTENRDGIVIALRSAPGVWDYRLADERFISRRSDVAFVDGEPAIVVTSSSGAELVAWDPAGGFQREQVLACEKTIFSLNSEGNRTSFLIYEESAGFVVAEGIRDASGSRTWSFRRGGVGGTDTLWVPQLTYLSGAPVVAAVYWSNEQSQLGVWEGDYLSAPITAEEVCNQTGAAPPAYDPFVTAVDDGDVMGLAASPAGDLYVLAGPLEGNNDWKEPALHARCAGSPWKSEHLDRTHWEVQFDVAPLMSDGRVIWAYNWGLLNNLDGPGRHLNYITEPEDSVMLATRLACPN